jgi:hypothetical protein
MTFPHFDGRPEFTGRQSMGAIKDQPRRLVKSCDHATGERDRYSVESALQSLAAA